MRLLRQVKDEEVSGNVSWGGRNPFHYNVHTTKSPQQIKEFIYSDPSEGTVGFITPYSTGYFFFWGGKLCIGHSIPMTH